MDKNNSFKFNLSNHDRKVCLLIMTILLIFHKIKLIINNFSFEKYSNREILNIKSSTWFLTENIYNKSAYFVRCCIDCAPNSKVRIQ